MVFPSWLVIAAIVCAAVLLQCDATAEPCQSMAEDVNIDILSGNLSISCTVPSLVQTDNFIWSIDYPYILTDCDQRATSLSCTTYINPNTSGTSVAEIFTLNNLQCLHQCVYHINIQPQVTPTLSSTLISSMTSSLSTYILLSTSHMTHTTLPIKSHMTNAAMSYHAMTGTVTLVEGSNTPVLSNSPIPSTSQNVSTAIGVGLLGVGIVFVLLVGGVAFGLRLWRLRQRTAKTSEETKVIKEEVDDGFLIGAQQDQLFDDNSSDVRTVPFTDIILHELIHEGTFKLVHHGKLYSTDISVKRLKDPTSELGRPELVCEIEAMKALTKTAGKDIHITSIVGVTEEPLCLLLEYVPHGTLAKFLKQLRVGPLPSWYISYVRAVMDSHYHKQVAEDMIKIMVQIADAGRYLTDNNFFHGDISTRNVLLGDNLLVKLTNLGNQKTGDYFEETGRKSFLQCMAPETLMNEEHTTKSDIWSFGILVFRIVTLESRDPYEGLQSAKNILQSIQQGARPKTFSCISKELHFLLQQCWQHDPGSRASFEKVYQSLLKLERAPSNHIFLKVSQKRKGYVSSRGEVFLQPPPNSIYSKDSEHKIRALPHLSVNEGQAYSSEEVTTEDSGVDLFTCQLQSDNKPLLDKSRHRESMQSSLISVSKRMTQNTPAIGWTTELRQTESGRFEIVRVQSNEPNY